MEFHLMSDKEQLEVEFWKVVLFALLVILERPYEYPADYKNATVEIKQLLKKLETKK